jgi:ribosomal-protein-alanine N-acetyltransferase
MALFRTVGLAEPNATIIGADVYLRAPSLLDYDGWVELRRTSRDFLVPWEPTWPEDDLTRLAFRRRVKRYAQELKDDSSYAFFLFRRSDDNLIGGLTLSNVRRGVAQACSLGYWMGAPHAGKGYMTAGVRSIIPFVFDTLRLHRLEAACMPHNKPSVRVLEKAGFTREGFARRYLCIAGTWQDHLLFAMVNDDPRP